jgi:hypothetical protein
MLIFLFYFAICKIFVIRKLDAEVDIILVLFLLVVEGLVILVDLVYFLAIILV